MLKRTDSVSRYSVLAVLSVISHASDSGAQPRPPQEQSGAQREGAAT